MPIRRRKFLQSFGSLAGSSLALPWLHPVFARNVSEDLKQIRHLNIQESAWDEDFWALVRQAYTSSANMVNLNSGGVSPHPKAVQEKVEMYNRFANEAPGYYMWRVMGKMRSSVRRKLADLAGTSDEEIALMRSATEALDTAILGIDLKKGEEILTTDQDYPSMQSALDLRANREGVKIVRIKLPVPATDPTEIVRRFEEAITPKTKVILACHIIYLTGHIMPIREIAAIAQKHNLQMIVDGAHSFCQLDFQVPDLGGDYFGTSLHKWLCAPFGTGMLYVKKNKISDLWPMHGYPQEEKELITKFEHLGTRSFPLELAVSDAIDFHNYIGTARKEARLRYLKEYWTNQVKIIPNIRFNTSLAPEHSCGIASFLLEGWDPVDLGNELTNNYNIYVTATSHDDVKGVRISPNVFTSTEELDYLAEIIHKLSKQKK
ncbi:MAG: aminotransferase class V-fold PLP-dependent enzyme [Bacteroidia bacterium]|nr:aminotransferase class V-fold PLP-dependent enzyme [Bacteroidia bacterium]